MTTLPLVESPPKPRRVLLVGNPNAGKTSLFNALTGLRAKTANYPGITVDLRKATIALPRHDSVVAADPPEMMVELIDLPGLYGMEATSPEEQLAAKSIRGELDNESDAILLVLDATNLSRNLFLAEEVLQYPRPAIVALTMSDVARQQGIDGRCGQVVPAAAVPGHHGELTYRRRSG